MHDLRECHGRRENLVYHYFSPEFTYQKLERSKIIATTKKTKETQGRLKTFQEEDKKSKTRGQTPKKGPPINN